MLQYGIKLVSYFPYNSYLCGGGVKYFHRDHASRRRRRNGKSQISYSKIWLRVPWDSDMRKTALARASTIYKRQTSKLISGHEPPMGSTTRLTDWPSVAMWSWLAIPLLYISITEISCSVYYPSFSHTCNTNGLYQSDLLVPNKTEILFNIHIARDSWETCWIAPIRKAYLF